MHISLLGPIQIVADDGVVKEIGGVRLRMLLARLALDPGRVVSVETLIDGLWGERPPTGAPNALQSLISRLRKALAGTITVESTGGGYSLAVSEQRVDALAFETLALRGSQELTADLPVEAEKTLTRALDLWRGEALADILGAPFAGVYSAKFTELRSIALENKFEAILALNRPEEVIVGLEEFTAKQPLRERAAALRMKALALLDRQAEALAVYEQIRRTLVEDLGVDPSTKLQETQLAVLRGELSLAEVRAESDTDRSMPLRLTTFVGRQEELALLTKLLSSSRLVTLVGPGGAGKTRLATEAIATHPTYEQGRAWFVPLAGVRDPKDIYSAVISVFRSQEVRLRDDLRSMQHVDSLERIVELLNGDDVLLLLDNCEHLIDAVADLAHELLLRLPQLRILATSREPLAITGETLCSLGSMELPQSGSNVTEANGTEAVRLFVDRATAVRSDFELNSSTVDSVVEICRQLDGMPLALELAAARLRSMTAAQIAQRLDDRFRLLGNGSRAVLPRQQTLRAVVEWSWELLDEPELILARRLSVFPAGANPVAVERICADDLLPVDDIFYVLGSLVEKSIVEAFAGEDNKPRYRMLETIRVYADERLADSGEQPATWRRLSDYLASFTEEQEGRLRGPQQLEAFAAMDVERENVLAVLRKSLDMEDVTTAYRLAYGSFWYWVIRGFDDQASSFVPKILQFSDQIPEYAVFGLRVIETLITSVPAVSETANIRAIIDDGRRAGMLEKLPGLAMAIPALALFSRDQELIEREIAHALENPDPWARACGYWIQRYSALDRGDAAMVEQAGAASLRLFREAGDRWGIAGSLAMQGEGYSLKGDHAAALSCYRESLALSKELAAKDEITQQQGKIVEVLIRSRDLSGAKAEIQELRQTAVKTRNELSTALVEIHTMDLARVEGDFALAHKHLANLEKILPRLPFPREMAEEWFARSKALLLISEGRTQEATEALTTSVRLAAQRLDMPDAAVGIEMSAKLFWQEGDPKAAAMALGSSQVVRGFFDFGNPELLSLITEIKKEIGEEEYLESYRRGAEMSKVEAIESFADRFGIEIITRGI